MTPFASKLDRGVAALCAAALALTAVLVSPVVVADGDLYWHIASGRWMLENHAVLRIDPFSATHAGYAWLALDWLSEAGLALCFIGAGWSAVLALVAATAALSGGLFAWFLTERLNAGVAAVVLALTLATAAGGLTASPAVLALPLFVIWCAGLARARAENRTPSLQLLIVMLLWANLDPSYLAGLVLALVMAIEAMSGSERLRAARGWGLFCGFALIVSLITPYGVEGFSEAIRQVQLPHSGDVRSALPLLLAVPAVALIVQARAVSARLVFLAGLFVLALYIKADQLLFAVAVPLLLADAAAKLLEQKGLASKFKAKPAAVFFVVAVGAIALRIAMPLERGDEKASPQSAFAQLPTPLQHAAVFNDSAFGGFLIFNDVRPYIDNRPLYRRSFRERYARMTGSDNAALTAMLERRHIRWTIFAPSSPAVKAMDGLKSWQRLYSDQWAVVHVRKGV